MSHIHVCLVSDQTIPNILGIHHFKPDELLFITTRKMKKMNKTGHILTALSRIGLDYGKRNHEIEVDEDSVLVCRNRLDDWIRGKEDKDFTVNLTGGTKIMSIAAYDYFKDYGSRMIYIPLGRNHYLTPYPRKALQTAESLNLRLKVADHLTAYGLQIVNEKKLSQSRDRALLRKAESAWIVQNYKEIKNLLIWLGGNLRPHRGKRKFNLSQPFLGADNSEQEFLDRLGFDYDIANGYVSKTIEKSAIDFFTGGWLEEFCFNCLFELIGEGIDDVVIGPQIRNAQGRENEFDVMFTRDNALYTVECKSLDQNEDRKTDALYKIGALQKEFGLRVESFFVSTSPHILRDGQLKSSVQARAEQFNTTVVTPDKVAHFADIVAEKLKIG